MTTTDRFCFLYDYEMGFYGIQDKHDSMRKGIVDRVVVPTIMLLHMRSYNFHDMTLSLE